MQCTAIENISSSKNPQQPEALTSLSSLVSLGNFDFVPWIEFNLDDSLLFIVKLHNRRLEHLPDINNASSG